MREEIGSKQAKEGKAWAGAVRLDVGVEITVPVSGCFLWVGSVSLCH